MDGLLIIDKPSGWTSHDVVARVRRLTGVRRVGHAGTLDPAATGLLPLGIGKGTRVLEYLGDADKTYRATVTLGTSTDTYDAEGRVTAESDWTGLTAAEVHGALTGFAGTIDQQAPAYSALKQGGRALYKLARAGVVVEPPVRHVTIYSIDEVSIDLPRLGFAVRCSKGTYIRSLAHDLGMRLGCGAHLSGLRRTTAGGFSEAQAVTLEQLEAACALGGASDLLLPLDAALLDRPAIVLDEAEAACLRDGVAPALDAVSFEPDTLCRAYDPSGVLVALLRSPGVERRWRAEKVLDSRSGSVEMIAET